MMEAKKTNSKSKAKTESKAKTDSKSKAQTETKTRKRPEVPEEFKEFVEKKFRVKDILDTTSEILARDVTDGTLPIPEALLFPVILVEVLKTVNEKMEEEAKQSK